MRRRSVYAWVMALALFSPGVVLTEPVTAATPTCYAKSKSAVVYNRAQDPQKVFGRLVLQAKVCTYRATVYAWTSSRTHREYYDHVSWKRGSSSTVGEVGGVRITFKATGKFVLHRSGWPDCVATARVEIVGAVGSGGVVTWNTESYSESFLFIPYFSGACWSNP